VLRDGETLARHAWGWANAERRIPSRRARCFAMCSITKQFTCGVVLDASPTLRCWMATCAPGCPCWNSPRPVR
jgi:hypothetical protein